MNTLKQIWDWSTAPATSIAQRDQRRQARFLASLLLFMLLYGVLIELILEPIFEPESSKSGFLTGETITLGLVTLAYLFSRTRQYTVGAFLLICFFSLGVFATLLAQKAAADLSLAYYLLIPIILSSMFLSLRLAIITTCANFLGMFTVSLYVTEISFFNFPLIFLSLTGCLLMFSVYYRNMLERDRQITLVESEEKHRTLLETVFEGIAILEHGHIINTNGGFTRIFGYSPTEAYHRPLADFIPTVMQTLAQLDQDNGIPVEIRGIRKDKQSIDLEIVTKSYMHHERATQMIAIRDMTERKRAEEALQQAQRLDSIGMLAGGIAHDFNNMLTAIMTQMSLALMKLSADSGARTHLDKAMKSVESASNLTHQLLAYAGKGQRHIKVTDLSQLVYETVEMVKTSLSNQVQLYLDIAAAFLPIEADQSQIQQVILNLVINAAEAMPDGSGEITITTKRIAISERSDTSIFTGQASLPAGEYAMLSVQDTGAGIDEEIRQRIFDPFFTTKETGHGLGLSTTLGVVRSHGGAIFVESEKGCGTLFTVLLPLASRHIPPAKPPRITRQRPPDQIPSVLVIDDEEPVRESIAEILETVGVQVLKAENGQVGIECYKEHRGQIGLAILDLKMPIMNGEETFYALQALNPNLKIILSSGYSEATTFQNAQNGAIDFLPKPYNMDALIEKVRGALICPSLECI